MLSCEAFSHQHSLRVFQSLFIRAGASAQQRAQSKFFAIIAESIA